MARDQGKADCAVVHLDHLIAAHIDPLMALTDRLVDDATHLSEGLELDNVRTVVLAGVECVLEEPVTILIELVPPDVCVAELHLVLADLEGRARLVVGVVLHLDVLTSSHSLALGANRFELGVNLGSHRLDLLLLLFWLLLQHFSCGLLYLVDELKLHTVDKVLLFRRLYDELDLLWRTRHGLFYQDLLIVFKSERFGNLFVEVGQVQFLDLVLLHIGGFPQFFRLLQLDDWRSHRLDK